MTERSVVPFFARELSTLLRERHAMTSWNNAADTVAIAPIIAARIVSESPMQVLSLSAAGGLCPVPAAALYCVTLRSLPYAVSSSVHGRRAARYVQRPDALNSATQVPLHGTQQIDRSEQCRAAPASTVA